MKIRSLSVAATLVALSACTEGTPTSLSTPNLQLVGADSVKFMTQTLIPEVTMEALYRGDVVVDEAGCIRLDSVDDATVIWPFGFTLRDVLDRTFVLDRSGETVGYLGGEFSLPGGEVEELHAGMGFTDEDRALAAEHCPGRYWIAGSP